MFSYRELFDDLHCHVYCAVFSREPVACFPTGNCLMCAVCALYVGEPECGFFDVCSYVSMHVLLEALFMKQEMSRILRNGFLFIFIEYFSTEDFGFIFENLAKFFI